MPILGRIPLLILGFLCVGCAALPPSATRPVAVQSSTELEVPTSEQSPTWRSVGDPVERQPVPAPLAAVGVDAGTGSRDIGPPRFEPETLPSPLAGSNPSYEMIYFPLEQRGEPADQSSIRAHELDTVAPRFGIYTFVLLGDAIAYPQPGAAAGLDTYGELLRVIETYVIAAESAPDASSGGLARQSHGFLLPVPAATSRGSLAGRTGPDLSERMRADFADYLRAGGQVELAQRLMHTAGPFLVSSLEPLLVPTDPRAPRMLVDLTEIGPEYMYSVVDAYDRPIPEEQVGRVDGLDGIRTRLLDLFPNRAVGPAGAAPPAAGWVYLFDRRDGAGSAPRAAWPSMLASARVAGVGVADVGDRAAKPAVIP